MEKPKSISAQKFLEMSKSDILILDIREADEVLAYPIENGVNIPFSLFVNKVDSIPKNKPVYVICNTGDLSEQIAEILADRDYDVTNVTGGVLAMRAQTHKKEATELFIDAKNLKCPGPIVKVADSIKSLKLGDFITVEATESAFSSDIAAWCERTGNILKSLNNENGIIKTTIVKSEPKMYAGANEHEKTFVVFSGDLDKAIASFIMANGAIAMGRNVTMFFTFWGLNILRKNEPVNVKKNILERLLGFMMPCGSKKLGLSRMNMGGIGAKMIRKIMENNGVSSLEELMQNAISHGVRLVACQMSMEIMGIKKEELIDGVTLGGVASMLSSTEKSDLTYFV